MVSCSFLGEKAWYFLDLSTRIRATPRPHTIQYEENRRHSANEPTPKYYFNLYRKSGVGLIIIYKTTKVFFSFITTTDVACSVTIVIYKADGTILYNEIDENEALKHSVVYFCSAMFTVSNNSNNKWSKLFENRPHRRRTWTVQSPVYTLA